MTDTRRTFLGKLVAGAGALGLGLASGPHALARLLRGGPAARPAAAASTGNAWVEGTDPYKATLAAVNALGGMEQFVKKNQHVTILPNIGWPRTMEQGANTHPEVVRALIELCHGAKAKSIRVFCNPCADIRVTLDKSGIGKVVDDSPAEFEFINNKGWRTITAVKGCEFMKSTEVYRVIDDADVLINCPVAKHHGGAQLTMCCKNLMGTNKDRGTMHQKLHTAIADLTMMVPSTLCVLDASRILLRNGPSGGNLKDVEWKNVLIAGTDPVEVDALGTTLFGMKPSDIGYLRILGERKHGEIDLAKVKVTRGTV